MANFAAKINNSLHGRDLGIQHQSTADGVALANVAKFLAGVVVDIRRDVTTAESTSVNVKAHGLTAFGTTSTGTGSSAVYTIDPPIPGLVKHIALSCGASDGPVYFKTANSETITSTAGSSFTTFKLSTAQLVSLVGVTTARWMTNMTSAAFTLLATST